MSKKHQSLDVVLSTFYRSAEVSKIRRSVRRVANYLDELVLKEGDSILEKIASVMTRECFSKTADLREKFFERNLLLGDTIAERLFKTDDLPFICSHALDIPTPKQWDDPGTFPARM